MQSSQKGESTGKAYIQTKSFYLLFVLHILLGLITRQYQFIATIHAVITVFLGIWFAIAGNHKKATFFSAYIVGSEVLWRMTGADVFWELGKYAIILIFGLLLIRFGLKKNSLLAILYILFLCVSIPLTISRLGINDITRQAISFNLSGPLSLAIAVIFFSRVEMNKEDLIAVCSSLLFPIVSIASIAIISISSSAFIYFTQESNFTTSGGYGPNQVSAMLGLGVLISFLLLTIEHRKEKKFFLGSVATILLTLTLLTFSRGGIYNLFVALSFATLHIITDRKHRRAFSGGIIIVFLLGQLFLFPEINEFTSGQFSTRFLDFNTAHRLQIAKAEYLIWTKNFLFGVGPGISKFEVFKYSGLFVASHTEYTRILSEHGLFGLMSMICLILIAIKAYSKSLDRISRFFIVAFVSWSIVEMGHAAMRIAVISFLFGLASVNWFLNES